ITLTGGMTLIVFRQWFKQDKLHYSDISFLFGLFFLGLMFGKCLDLLYKLTYFTADNDNILILLKFRYILIILTIIPLIFISNDIIFLRGSQYHEKFANDNYRNRLNISFIVIIISIESVMVIISPNLIIISLVLMCIHIPSLAWITYTFYYAYRNEQLLQIKPLLISVIFSVIPVLFICFFLKYREIPSKKVNTFTESEIDKKKIILLGIILFLFYSERIMEYPVEPWILNKVGEEYFSLLAIFVAIIIIINALGVVLAGLYSNKFD
ncbi:unnamed protein product, partial [marine sediment metagenome]